MKPQSPDIMKPQWGITWSMSQSIAVQKNAEATTRSCLTPDLSLKLRVLEKKNLLICLGIKVLDKVKQYS